MMTDHPPDSSSTSGFSRSNFAPLPHRHADISDPASASVSASAAASAGLPAPPASSLRPPREGDEDVDLYRDLAVPTAPSREDYPPYASGPGGYGRGGGGGGGYGRGEPMGRDRSWEGREGRRGPPGRGEREREMGMGMGMDPEREYESWERRMDEDRWGGPGARRGREWEDDFDRPKRRRSPSPLGPPSHRARLHSPSPPPQPSSHSARRHRPPPRADDDFPDPASLEHILTYRQFSEWFRASHPQTAKADEDELRRANEEDAAASGGKGRAKVGMPKRFERYRREYNSRQLYALYLSHRASPWFQERYGSTPEHVALRRRLARQGRVPTVETYLDKLRVGEYDSISYDLTEEEIAGQAPEEDDRKVGTDKAEPEGLDRALDDVKRPTGMGGAGSYEDDPLRIEVPPRKGQVFIKTVPPSVSRIDLEEIFAKEEGFQYLALTEPSTKKSFHRVGWAQFKDGVDAGTVVERVDETKIDTFTYHMGVNTAPVIGRTRLTQPIANTLDRLLIDAEKAKQLAVKLEDDLIGDDEEPASATGEKEGDAPGMESEAERNGDGVKPEDVQTRPDADSADGNTEAAGDEVEKGAKAGWRHRRWPGLRERGSDIVQERIDRLVEDLGLGGEGVAEEVKVKRTKLTLDHWLSYLRSGLSTCYYCIASMSFPEELERKCIMHKRPAAVHSTAHDGAGAEGDEGGAREVEHDDGAHAETMGEEEVKEEGGAERDGDEDMDVRDADVKPDTNGGENASVAEGKRSGARHGQAVGGGRERSQDERWAEYLDFRLKPLLWREGEGQDMEVVEYLGRDVDEETRKLCAPHIKQEEASKYRCKECNKLFKAPEFVIKHIASKHHELIRGKLEEIETFNNFALDPHHIQILSSTPAAVDDRLPPSLTNPLAVMQVPLSMPIFNPDFAGGDRPGPGNGNGGRGGDRGGGGGRRRDRGPPLAQGGYGADGGPGGGGAGAGGGPGASFGMPGGMTVMQQQMMMMMQMQAAMLGAGGAYGAGAIGAGGGGPGGLGGGRGGGGGGGVGRGVPAHIGQPGTEDPRARRGRVSYRDLDDPSGPRGGGAKEGGEGEAEDEGLPY